MANREIKKKERKREMRWLLAFQRFSEEIMHVRKNKSE